MFSWGTASRVSDDQNARLAHSRDRKHPCGPGPRWPARPDLHRTRREPRCQGPLKGVFQSSFKCLSGAGALSNEGETRGHLSLSAVDCHCYENELQWPNSFSPALSRKPGPGPWTPACAGATVERRPHFHYLARPSQGYSDSESSRRIYSRLRAPPGPKAPRPFDFAPGDIGGAHGDIECALGDRRAHGPTVRGFRLRNGF